MNKQDYEKKLLENKINWLNFMNKVFSYCADEIADYVPRDRFYGRLNKVIEKEMKNESF